MLGLCLRGCVCLRGCLCLRGCVCLRGCRCLRGLTGVGFDSLFVFWDLRGLTGIDLIHCLFSVAKRRDDTSGDLRGLTGVVLICVCLLGPPGTYRSWFWFPCLLLGPPWANRSWLWFLFVFWDLLNYGRWSEVSEDSPFIENLLRFLYQKF